MNRKILNKALNDKRTVNVLVLVLGCIVLAGLFWVNNQFSKDNPGGNDFLVHYVGTRSYLLEGISPYSDEVAVRIQTAAYGRPAEGVEHELRVAYPLYSIFLFAPFSLIADYQIARAIWMVVLEIGLVLTCFLAFELVEWKPPLWIQALFLVFSLLWYHAARGVVNGNAVILIGLMITGAFLAIKREQDQLAGVLLAATTIKPHLVVLLIPYVLLWAIYRRRWRVIAWFAVTMGVFLIVSLVLMPDWILQNLWEIMKYPDYNPAGTLAAALGEWMPGIAGQLKWGIALIFGLLLVWEWWRTRQGKFELFLWTGMLTLVLSQWIGIQTDPGNFILLFPALMVIVATSYRKWPKQGKWIVISILGVLLIGLWVLFILTVQETYQPVQSPIMFLPLPGICLLGLYWIKWWVSREHYMLLQEDL